MRPFELTIPIVTALATLAACGGSSGAAPAECTAPSQCPGEDTECRTRTCAGGTCGFSYAADAVVVTTQAAGDCRVNRCDGAGGVHAVPDDLDVPGDDGDACTLEVCDAGTPRHPSAPQGTGCTQGGGSVCDGAGHCVSCLRDEECPPGGACQVARCVSGACGFDPAPAQTLAAGQQAPGDCHVLTCDGLSQVAVSTVDDADAPLDGEECTVDVCSAGVASHPPIPAGTPCGPTAGPRCDDAGRCVQCLQASDCGTSTACRVFACAAGGVCGSTSTAAGTVASDPSPGDCRSDQCDGSGGLAPDQIDTADVPFDDGNQCTLEVCVAGTPQHPTQAEGTPCNQNGGTVCDGTGACVMCTLDAECPGGGECQVARCHAGVCGFVAAPAAPLPLPLQLPGDCQTLVCDGVGQMPVPAVDDTDVQDDGRTCTADLCVAGFPAHLPLEEGTPCDVAGACSATGDCVWP